MKHKNSRNPRSQDGDIIVPGCSLSQRRLRRLNDRALRGFAVMLEMCPTSGWVTQLNDLGFTFEALTYQVQYNDPLISCFQPVMQHLQSSKGADRNLTNLEYYGFAIEDSVSDIQEHYAALDYLWKRAVEFNKKTLFESSVPAMSPHPATIRILIEGVNLPQKRLRELRQRVRRGVAWLKKRSSDHWVIEAMAHDFQFQLMKLRSGLGSDIFSSSYWDLEKLGEAASGISSQAYHGFETEAPWKDVKMEYLALDFFWTAEAKKLLCLNV